jgi:DNA-directed RNA polymerase II subunit RPB2
MDQDKIWKIIDSQFRDNPQALVRHHVDSFNDFYKNDIFKIFKEKNPIRISSQLDAKTGEYKTECNMYFGGKTGNRIYFGKPVIYDNNSAHYMFPNEARLRNMTYGMTIHYDIEVEYITRLSPGENPPKFGGGDLDEAKSFSNFKKNPRNQFEEEETKASVSAALHGGGPKATAIKKKAKPIETDPIENMTPSDAAKERELTQQSLDETGSTYKRSEMIERVYLGKFPIMLQSDFCVLRGCPRDVRHTMGECRNDLGGYFIIDGKEKTVVAQEKFADNMLYIKQSTDEEFLYSAEIRSVSENVSKPVRTMSVKLVAPSSYSNRNIVVNIPNVRKPVPLFIVFRALGILSDKDIISFCLLDLEKYDSLVDLFIPSVHDSANIMTQQTALKYIGSLTKGKTVNHALEILSDYFLPHLGEINYTKKSYFLGNMVFRLLSVYSGLEQPTDRDNFKNKRIELVGSLLYDLFREYWSIQLRQIHLEFEKRLYYNTSVYENDLPGLISANYRDILKQRSLEQGFRKAFKGNWGAQTHTKRIGVVQDINRLSFNSALNHLRKTNLPLDASVKLVGPRVLHSSQWGFIDPIDTPDGASIGLHKHLAISTCITRGMSREPIVAWTREKWGLKLVEEYSPIALSRMTKVFVNGDWIGSVSEPLDCIRVFRLYRRNALLPIFASATFDIKLNTIFVYTDAGRLCRPIFYRDEETGGASYNNKELMKMLSDGKFTWSDLIAGFNEKKKGLKFDAMEMKMYELSDLYESVQDETNPAKLDQFIKKKAAIDYIDASESENALISLNYEEFELSLKSGKSTEESRLEKKADLGKIYTHCEIHESLLFGMMCNMIIFPENNPASRNSFSCGQSKQACSLYHTNYQVRMDKTGVLLNYGQIPLVKSRYLEYIQHEENPYGENAIVAIMCYTGYNVEDAVLINEGAINRGLFRTTYFSTYEAHEESTKNAETTVDKKFTNIESDPLVIGTKPGYDYSKLDKHGLIKEGTLVDDKTVLIGITSYGGVPSGSNVSITPPHIDGSKVPKKGQLGVVDKTFITEGEEGFRIAKVRVLEQRIPAIGDKMASRSGQKGTIGLVVPERDMPFTKDGLRPDIIINPHALPTRMTIGQLVECITGKACAIYGGFGDCTAFVNKGSKIGVFGELLTQANFHSSGNELLYNGMTGEQLETEIFIGPTYYMRLKHMVKDKINYRALGPRTALTRQPVSGRANDGGLRIGEMERDSIISHGAADFLRESMMERGDKSYVAVCNKTGMISIFNPANNLFISPMADGPLKFVGSFEGSDLRVEYITQFGRDFSVICIPYSLKLLIQELQTINLQMRVITEDNLEQMDNLSYSKNIETLLQAKDLNPEELIKTMRERIEERKTKLIKTPNDNLYTPSPEIGFPTDVSPAYQPDEFKRTVYGENSPEYELAPKKILEEGEIDESDKQSVYQPHSPEDSPDFSTWKQQNASDSPDFATWKEQNATPETLGGGGGGDAWNIGDRVLMRGGGNQMWEIANVGDKFHTIVALGGQMLSKEERVKVVGGGEIYRPGNVVYGGQMPVQQNDAMMQPPGFDMMTGGAPPPFQINFAPKIITGGNDNSVGADPVSAGSTMSGGGMITANVPNIIMGGGSSDGIVPKANLENAGTDTTINNKDFNKGLFIVNKGGN